MAGAKTGTRRIGFYRYYQEHEPAQADVELRDAIQQIARLSSSARCSDTGLAGDKNPVNLSLVCGFQRRGAAQTVPGFLGPAARGAGKLRPDWRKYSRPNFRG